ncbi:MAG TPA: hypothetical protein VK250_07675 [Nitrososphaeraceae archaeon]|nr:hypothetical protein [Nitrososphaeraceae archaeon]
MVIIGYNRKKYKESLGKKTEILLALCIIDNRNTELEDGNMSRFINREIGLHDNLFSFAA